MLEEPDQVAISASIHASAETASRGAAENGGRGRRRKRSDWRLGGRSVHKWDFTVLSVALIAAGLGIVGATAARRIDAAWGVPVSSLVLWAALSSAAVYALIRARPVGLLRLRSIDVLWGVGLGLLLRALDGWLSSANSTTFPTAATLDGVLPLDWWWKSVVPAGFLAPLVEEFFFRAVLLVTVYQLLRRSVGIPAAGLTALLVSTGTFVLVHAIFDMLPLAGAIQLFAIGAVLSLLVLLTGRIWGAVLVHVVYNVTYLVLVILGTLLA